MVTKMPLAEASGRVTVLSEQLRDRRGFKWQPEIASAVHGLLLGGAQITGCQLGRQLLNRNHRQLSIAVVPLSVVPATRQLNLLAYRSDTAKSVIRFRS